MRAPLSKRKPPDYFFKLIPPGLVSPMSIPASFRKYMKTNTAAILKKGCRKWPVKVIAFKFGEGWEDFVRENGVQELDIVVFKHEGNMVFDTMVFDTSLCEKEYPTDQAVLAESSSGAKLLKSHVMVETESLNCHPYFVTTLKQHGRQKCMYLPWKFSVENGLHNGEMILKSAENEGSWTVHLLNPMDNFFYVRRGLHEFCIANGLEIGESLKFVLIQNGEKPVAIISRLTKAPPIRKEGVLDPYFQKVDVLATPSSPNHTAPVPLLNPYFKSTVTAYNIKNAYVSVPLGFARPNGLYNRNCEMVVMDEKRRLWPTRFSNTDRSHVRIKGFDYTKIANGLKEGDDFLLELVDSGNKPFMQFHRVC